MQRSGFIANPGFRVFTERSMAANACSIDLDFFGKSFNAFAAIDLRFASKAMLRPQVCL
jgi:hypothetical protein